MSVHREEKIRICQVPCQPINFKQQISTSKLKADLAYDANLTTGNPGIAKITQRNCSLYSCQVQALENKTNDQFPIMPCFLLGGSVYSHFRPWLTIFFLLRLFHSYLYLHILFISLSSLYLRLFFLKSRMPFPPPTDSRGRRRQRISSLRRAMPLTVRI